MRLKLLLLVLLVLPVSAQPNVESRVDAILQKMTLSEKIKLLGGTHDFYTQAIPRVGIPSLRMSDGPLGVHDYGLVTAYPAPIGLAASFDAPLAQRVGHSMGKDARAYGVHVILAPGMNIYRAPTNGRNFEYLGEDPFLAGRIAVNVIDGIQAEGVMACAKHYACNQQEYGRMDHSSDVDERTLRELYLPAFEACVKEARVATIMDAYNLVNGVYCTENRHLNIEIAKQEWGFDGVIMSDWGATHDGVAAANGGLDLEMPSAVYMTEKALVAGGVSQATIDDKVRRILRKAIQFGFFDREQRDPLQPALSQEGRQVALEGARNGMVLLKNSGVLPLDRDRARSVLVVGPNAYPAVPGGGGSSQTKSFNAVSFLEGISTAGGPKVRVLYATETVDLDNAVKGAAFVTQPGGPAGLHGEYFDNEDLSGPPALERTDEKMDLHFNDGSYRPGGPADHFSARWTGYFVPPATDDYRFVVSADDGVRLFVNDQRIINDWQPHGETLTHAMVHLEGGKPAKVRLEYFEAVGWATVRLGVTGSQQPLDAVTQDLARKADAVVVCVGFNPDTEGEGSDRAFRLPTGQDALIRSLSALSPRVVVVLNAGGNVDMQPWLEGVGALIHAWYPGQEGGTALGQLLFGDYSPSGKLPASFEKRWEDNPAYNFYRPQGTDRKVPYREGLSLGYRHYDRSSVKPQFPFGFGLSYTTFAYSGLEIAPDATVSFTVRNTGKRTGAEVAELYVGDGHSKVERPLKELKGFARVELKPGESRRLSIKLDKRAFSYYDVDSKGWRADPGSFKILVGGSSDKIALEGAYTLH